MSEGWIMGLIADMQDAPLTRPTAKGGNHPLWCLGHLAYSEGNLVHKLCQGKENPVEDWAGVFKEGSDVSDNADDYPSMDDLLAKSEEIRSATLAHLDTLTDDDLDKKSHAPEEFGAFFGTIGACLAAMTTHMSFHAGQVADARRAAGRSPLMA